MRETHRERQRHRQWEKQAPCREPNVGLDPGTPGSRPELKADTQLLSRPGAPNKEFLPVHLHTMGLKIVLSSVQVPIGLQMGSGDFSSILCSIWDLESEG